MEEAKVPINTLDKENNTPLHLGAESGSYNSLMLLIDHLLKQVESTEEEEDKASDKDGLKSSTIKPLTPSE